MQGHMNIKKSAFVGFNFCDVMKKCRITFNAVGDRYRSPFCLISYKGISFRRTLFNFRIWHNFANMKSIPLPTEQRSVSGVSINKHETTYIISDTPGCWWVLSLTRKATSYSDQTLNFASHSKKKKSEDCPINQVSAAAINSASDEKWRPLNCFFSRVGLRTYQHPCIFMPVRIYNSCLCIISIVVWYVVTAVSDKHVTSHLRVEM